MHDILDAIRNSLSPHATIEQCARTLAVAAGVGTLTAKRAFRGDPIRGAGARKISAALLAGWGLHVPAGDLALGVEVQE